MTSTFATWSERVETAVLALLLAALPMGAVAFVASSF